MKNFCLFLTRATFLSLVLTSSAFAQAAAATAGPHQPSFGEILSKMAPMFLVVFVFFHFFIIRPQKAKETQHAELLNGLKTGDSVVTSSGIIGRVASTTPQYVTLEVSQGVKIRFEPAHVVKREEAAVKQ